MRKDIFWIILKDLLSQACKLVRGWKGEKSAWAGKWRESFVRINCPVIFPLTHSSTKTQRWNNPWRGSLEQATAHALLVPGSPMRAYIWLGCTPFVSFPLWRWQEIAQISQAKMVNNPISQKGGVSPSMKITYLFWGCGKPRDNSIPNSLSEVHRLWLCNLCLVLGLGSLRSISENRGRLMCRQALE